MQFLHAGRFIDDCSNLYSCDHLGIYADKVKRNNLLSVNCSLALSLKVHRLLYDIKSNDSCLNWYQRMKFVNQQRSNLTVRPSNILLEIERLQAVVVQFVLRPQEFCEARHGFEKQCTKLRRFFQLSNQSMQLLASFC